MLSSSIEMVGIPTRNRSRCLLRCLESVVAANKRSSREPRYVVADSSDAPIQRDHRVVLDHFAIDQEIVLDYLGNEEADIYTAALAQKAGVAEEVVRFALRPTSGQSVTTGASRNLLLLKSAGELSLQIDDDVVHAIRSVSGRGELRTATAVFDPTEFWPCVERVNGDACNLLTIHEQLLGHSFDDTRVISSAAGVWDDPGMSSSVYLLTLQGPSRARLMADEATYRSCLHRRELERGVVQPTIGGGLCVGLNLGLDQRVLLPPFLPMHRNQDGVFAALVRGCFPDYRFGFLPWLVQHSPPRRGSGVRTWRDEVKVHSGQIVQALIRWLAPTPQTSDAAGNLIRLGQQLLAVSQVAERQFGQSIDEIMKRELGQLRSLLQQRLIDFGDQPAYWAHDVREAIAALTDCIGAAPLLADSDLSKLRCLLRDFGGVLQCWPAIVAAARQLNWR